MPGRVGPLYNIWYVRCGYVLVNIQIGLIQYCATMIEPPDSILTYAESSIHLTDPCKGGRPI